MDLKEFTIIDEVDDDEPLDEELKKSNELRLHLPRLSGAAKKRFRWLIRNGHEFSEARKLAVKPLNKRVHSSVTPQGAQNKRSRIEVNEMDKSSPASIGQIESGFEIGLLSKYYPEELLSMDQMKAIQEAILNKIVEIRGHYIVPQFHSSTFKKGWMLINCNGEDTAKWLKSVVEQLKPWEGAYLMALEGNKIPQPVIMIGLFPNSAEDSNEKILSLLKAQNPVLDVEEWEIINRDDRNEVTKIVLSFDQHSEAKLKLNNFDLNYKFGRVQLR